MGGMTDQPGNRFVFRVVVVEFAVNGNQALQTVSIVTLKLFKFLSFCSHCFQTGT